MQTLKVYKTVTSIKKVQSMKSKSNYSTRFKSSSEMGDSILSGFLPRYPLSAIRHVLNSSNLSLLQMNDKISLYPWSVLNDIFWATLLNSFVASCPTPPEVLNTTGVNFAFSTLMTREQEAQINHWRTLSNWKICTSWIIPKDILFTIWISFSIWNKCLGRSSEE